MLLSRLKVKDGRAVNIQKDELSQVKDSPAPKDFFDLDEWKAKAKELGYSIENNTQRGLWVARQGIGEMGAYNPTKGGWLYTDQTKIKDGRAIGKTRDEINYGEKVFEKNGWIIEKTPQGTFVIKKPSGNYYGSPSSLEEGKKYIENELKASSQDSITEGSKIVVNTENHVNESAIAVTVNEDNCLVRFENGDEETIPIESISAFESMANDASAPKDFFDLDEWKIKAKSLGYIVENNSQRGLWVARVGIREMGTYNPLKGGTLYTDQSPSETETKINELKQNMDAARARGYDTAPYQKEIDRLKSMDAESNRFVEEYKGYKIYKNPIGLRAIPNNGGEAIDDIRYGGGDLIELRKKIDRKNRGQDKYTGDPLTAKGQEIMASLKEQYGEEKGEQVFYAMKNSGQIEGID